MWDWIITIFLGICAGVTVAGGLVALLIALGIVSRYAEITKTADKIHWYEGSIMAGAFFGVLWYFFGSGIQWGTFGLIVFGVCAGIFLGSWIIALGEVTNIFPVLLRKLQITRGIGWLIAAIAIAKTVGSLLFFRNGWWK
ncbi:MAG: stage V sporulation protein AB [Ruminococcus sp.]|nr:stage V sporulation protein AB [Ruminococcus sp.]